MDARAYMQLECERPRAAPHHHSAQQQETVKGQGANPRPAHPPPPPHPARPIQTTMVLPSAHWRPSCVLLMVVVSCTSRIRVATGEKNDVSLTFYTGPGCVVGERLSTCDGTRFGGNCSGSNRLVPPQNLSVAPGACLTAADDPHGMVVGGSDMPNLTSAVVRTGVTCADVLNNSSSSWWNALSMCDRDPACVAIEIPGGRNFRGSYSSLYDKASAAELQLAVAFPRYNSTGVWPTCSKVSNGHGAVISFQRTSRAQLRSATLSCTDDRLKVSHFTDTRCRQPITKAAVDTLIEDSVNSLYRINFDLLSGLVEHWNYANYITVRSNMRQRDPRGDTNGQCIAGLEYVLNPNYKYLLSFREMFESWSRQSARVSFTGSCSNIAAATASSSTASSSSTGLIIIIIVAAIGLLGAGGVAFVCVRGRQSTTVVSIGGAQEAEVNKLTPVALELAVKPVAQPVVVTQHVAQSDWQAELSTMNVGALRQEAASKGVPAQQIEAARDSDDPKGALIALMRQAELRTMNVGALRQEAASKGVPAQQIEAARDSDDPKGALIALIVACDGQP
eukprot:COSAG01_NODE_230_length_21075_cov_13.811603_29_plen_563_part_00